MDTAYITFMIVKLCSVNILRISLLVTTGLLLLVFGGGAHASLITVSCNGGPQVTAGVVTCLNLAGNAHLLTADADGSTAGLNNFYNSININYNSAAAVQPNQTTQTGFASTITFPTWDPSVKIVDTSLTLNGAIEFPDPKASITLDLIGWLGGPPLEILKTFTSADCPPGSGFCSFRFTETNSQSVSNSALETLNITSVGRVLYQNNDTFVGAAPEPTTFALLGLGLAGLRFARRKIGIRKVLCIGVQEGFL